MEQYSTIYSSPYEQISHKGKIYTTHTILDKKLSAIQTYNPGVILIFLIFILILSIINLFLGLKSTIIVIVAIVTLVYFIDSVFLAFLIVRSFIKEPEITVLDEEIKSRVNWPTYTIFCPLYKEGAVLWQFLNAIHNLDYPKDRLETMLLFEEDDKETIAMAQSLNLPNYFKIVIIPHSQPKTKPKAVNFGLLNARGEYAVIFDAEDVPDKDQLKKAVIAFEKVKDNSLICIQAKLNFYNPQQNLLTKMFTAEYSLWFDLILTGLQSINAPIPLGGTSNHFRTSLLREIGAWDPFNVTEDCDLGLRIAKKGYRTAIFNSTTWEEANSNLKNWIRQRSRWIKGYMQTYLVHMRDLRYFVKQKNFTDFIILQFLIGGKVTSIFINPVMWCITVAYFALRSIIGSTIESFFPTPIFYMAVFSLIIGNFLYIYYHAVGYTRRSYWNLTKYIVFIPFYWLLISVAGWMSLYQLIFKPHFWEKTNHGLHLKKNNLNSVNMNTGV